MAASNQRFLRTTALAALGLLVLVTLTAGQTSPAPPVMVNVSETCLACICEAVSNCNTSLRCEGDVCGVFRITRGYWIDAGSLTLPQQDPTTDGYEACALDPYCAGQVVRAYMARYATDCNNDGRIDCTDYAAIHRLGAWGCGGPLDLVYVNKYSSCKRQVEAVGGRID